ncbi:tRNA delta(2)-isopentenylpyrophosphate transferase, putative [Plasmodium chabaudi adami]|uniref:tRNA dimethylallyltransferase n=1 Tax=Plasmodium chabaudi adami TaxID=5826 RepID=A0A1D3RRZ1_PLACE|nr:tRNA delta(2)-isopentenylpyrophosphate transferase, putative [Plasmodium chabaudi adami]
MFYKIYVYIIIYIIFSICISLKIKAFHEINKTYIYLKRDNNYTYNNRLFGNSYCIGRKFSPSIKKCFKKYNTKLYYNYKKENYIKRKVCHNNRRYTFRYICNKLLGGTTIKKRNAVYCQKNKADDEKNIELVDVLTGLSEDPSKVDKMQDDSTLASIEKREESNLGNEILIDNQKDDEKNDSTSKCNGEINLSCFNMNTKEKKKKVVIIMGITCSGKTQFSIDLYNELLKHDIKGEIISADSMQVYKNFSVGVAKVENEEMGDIKHHMLDVCDNTEEFNAHKFVNYAIPIIEAINDRNMLPIVAGGTLLYIESLLWESVVDIKKENDIEIDKIKHDDYTNKTNDELHEELKMVDPERAEELHKNDRKRICRSLDIFYTFNKKHSDLIKMKCHKNNKLDKTRYAPCFFYLDHKDDCILKDKIENRINVMISKGLLEEGMKLKKMPNNTNTKLKGKGIRQSIAYKEFDSYIEKKINNIDDNDLFNKCKDNLFRKTYQYAKRQRRWILNRFVKRYNIPLNEIDVSKNYEQQLSNAVKIVLDFWKN